MRKSLLSLSLFFIFLSALNGQTALPTMTYKLHAQKELHSSNLPSTLIHLTLDQALIVLIPQQDGKWLFKRITAWETNSPKEETLSFAAQPVQEGASGFEDLKVDPEEHYAVIRLRSFSGSISAPNRTRSAVIVIVDLHGFTIVSQQATTDLLLASGEWAFAKNGMLIVSALTERVTTPEKPKNEWSYETISDNYRAAALTLPKLTQSTPCQYALFLDHRNSSTRSDRYLSKTDDGCAALVALAQVPAADNLPDGPPKPVPYAALAGPNCDFGGKSPDAAYVLYGCRTGHDYLDGMIATTNTRNLTVLKVPSGQHVLEVPLPHNMTPYPALLATAGDHTWLLLLRDGIKLESYLVP
jgi:hypothetical protein